MQMPFVTKNLLLANVVIFFLSLVMPSLTSLMGLHYWQASQFHVYQLVTYMFMHGGWTHLFFNMFALWMFGCVMERTWGPKRFIIYYLVCGIGAGLLQELAQFGSLFLDLSSQGATIGQIIRIQTIDPTAPEVLNAWTTVGASGSIYGILLAFGMTYPEEKMFIIPIPFPIKAKWFVMGYIVIELVMAFESPGDGVAHVAHLGGMLFGFFLIRHWRSTARRQSTFDGWNSYQGTAHRDDSATILGRIRKWMHLDREGNHNANTTNNGDFRTTSTHQSDWDYNARRKQEEAEIDAILEKIRRSGYASLTAEEKKKLFEASKK